MMILAVLPVLIGLCVAILICLLVKVITETRAEKNFRRWVHERHPWEDA